MLQIKLSKVKIKKDRRGGGDTSEEGEETIKFRLKNHVSSYICKPKSQGYRKGCLQGNFFLSLYVVVHDDNIQAARVTDLYHEPIIIII